MNIIEIYKKYFIPVNLQMHMLRVAGVGKLICDGFDGEIGSDVVIKALLLHDMGNILKYNFDYIDLLTDEDKLRVDELKNVQRQYVTKYGGDCDNATEMIIREVVADDRIVQICKGLHGEYSKKLIKSDNWEEKIAYYCDMRVGPFGILSVEKRFDDLIKRYSGEKKKNFEKYRENCLLIEKQIQRRVNFSLDEIDDEMVGEVIKQLKKWEI